MGKIKKHPKRKTEPFRPVRLSQCMIVKNEEKNIERALSWGKGVVCEQIVVDTGSTDRTVEIAERMGAKVYHFEWINDFSAAKNYAIEQAKGNWIAFLDADEYLSTEDTKKLYDLLKTIERSDPLRNKEVIICNLINLNINNEPKSSARQTRVFRNLPHLRYHNAIHEQLYVKGEIVPAYEISIMHTGYAADIFHANKKRERNENMLREQIAMNPDDYNLKAYLAETLFSYEQYDEAVELYNEIMSSDKPVLDQIKYQLAILHINHLFKKNEDADLIEKTVTDMIYRMPLAPDFYYFMGELNFAENNFETAYSYYEKAYTLMQNDNTYSGTFMFSLTKVMFFHMLQCCEKQNDEVGVIKYGTILLNEDKYMETILTPWLAAFKKSQNRPSDDELFGLITKLYDLNQVRDKFFVFRSAREAGLDVIAKRVSDMIAPEEWELLNETPNPVFHELIQAVSQSSEKELAEFIKQGYFAVDIDNRTNIDKFYAGTPDWGALEPEKGDFETFERRAHILKTRCGDFVWLYDRLLDARSKNVLFSIMSNWLNFDFKSIYNATDNVFCRYFDINLIKCDENEIFVDVGAFIGDSAADFINTYKAYKKIYCYETEPANFTKLAENLKQCENIDMRLRGAGDKNEKIVTGFNVCSSGEGASEIEYVRLDDDIDGPVTFIKMGIEGAEKAALRGSERLIKENKPKLAISTHSGYDDIIEIPKMIYEMNPDYKFYMRHYGGNLIPTRFVFYAV